ncbi:MAG TPA: NAD(P)-dependent oxidoreductase [Acidimicrobiia bacterium]|jgi:3-hydroxyisobutyrate dehydrogenase-like beta-hydroxyacid dehydrogenase
MDLAVIGLGLMGGTLARHLLADGHAVVGFDPEAERAGEHAGRGGVVASSVAEAVAGVEVALLSLPNSSVMLEVVHEIASSTRDGLLVVDTTTGEPDDAVAAWRALAEAGADFVDATISGNAAQAAVRDVIFMAGGSQEAVAVATTLLRPLGRAVYHVGPVGSGAIAKLIVNHVLSINRAAVAEGLTVAEKAGVDLEEMLLILRDSAAYSKAMDIWGDRMVAADHYPPSSRVRQSHKDSRLINGFAESVGASHVLADAVRRALVDAEDGGLSDADNSSVMEVMRRRAGIGRHE